MYMIDSDRVFNFLRMGMNVINDPMLSPLIDEAIGSSTIKQIPIPGFSKEDVKVTHDRGKLTVKVNDKFLASYHVPSDIDPSKIEVTAENGLLTIDFENAFGKETEIEIK